MTPPVHDALTLLLPPLGLLELMREVLRRKALRGDPIPELWVTWLVRADQAKRGNLPDLVRVLSDEEWTECCAEFGEFVKGEG